MTAGFWSNIAKKYTDRNGVTSTMAILDEEEDLLGVTVATP